MLPIFILAINNSADRSFAEVLYERHKDKIYKTAYKILHNEHDAEDATSETFIKIMDNLQNYYDKSEDALAGIFVTITKHTAIDKYRRKNKVEIISIPEDYTDENDFDYVADFVVKQELYKELYQSLDGLDEDYSNVVKLKMEYDYSDMEIAKILEISVENVKTRYHRAKKMLSKSLNKNKTEKENGQ
ncbi:MAG: sigma-70 family RNA polymerase sigma factor [Oscillospiraceae bacterium]|nr:sigma-70 family RNA polymerase sigma factor [Oscillospiraceae bacterium]